MKASADQLKCSEKRNVFLFVFEGRESSRQPNVLGEVVSVVRTEVRLRKSKCHEFLG